MKEYYGTDFERNCPDVARAVLNGLLDDPVMDGMFLLRQLNDQIHDYDGGSMRPFLVAVIRDVVPQPCLKLLLQCYGQQETDYASAVNAMTEKDYSRAVRLLKKILDPIVRLFAREEDPYTNVTSLMDLELMKSGKLPFHTERNVQDFPIVQLLNLYGSALMQLDQKEEAAAAFHLALHFNPVCAAAWLNLADVCEYEDPDLFISYNEMAFPYCYRQEDLSRFYLNRAMSEAGQRKYLSSVLSLAASRHYSGNESAEQLMKNILSLAHLNGVEFSEEQIRQAWNEQKDFCQADPETYAIAWTKGNEALEEGKLKEARYFLNLCSMMNREKDCSDLLAEAGDFHPMA